MAVDIERTYQQSSPAPAGSLFETFDEQVRRRVYDVLAGRECLYPIPTVANQFLRLLLQHQGAHRSVSRRVWAERLGLEDRVLRELVQTLRQDFGIAVGTVREGGYYLCATRQEFDEQLLALTGRAVTILRVAKGMSGGGYDELLQQLRLQLGGKDPF